MHIDKSQVVDLLKSRGDHDQAAKAESELPGKVDPEADAGLLGQLGIDPQDLLGHLPGGLAKGLGGLGG